MLAGLDAEDQVAVRATGIAVRRLTHAPSKPSTRPWVPRGTILITGGTGGLGGQVARWAAAEGAEHLVLTSRRGPSAPGLEQVRAELTALGARVTVLACDLGDRDAVAGLLASLDGDLTAVVHAAGVAQDQPLMTADGAHLDRVLAGKVDGAIHLDDLLADTPLDAFVVFSSISGIWGSGGQVAYSAANAGLDAVVQRRREAGRVATAVAWGPWAQVGMTDDPQLERQVAPPGPDPDRPAAGGDGAGRGGRRRRRTAGRGRRGLGPVRRHLHRGPAPPADRRPAPSWSRLRHRQDPRATETRPWPSAWPACRRLARSDCCSTWSGPRSPPSWGTPPRRRSWPAGRSRNSASTR